MVFDPTTVTLQHVGKSGGPSEVYNQSAKNFEPRIGLCVRSVREEQDADPRRIRHHDRSARLRPGHGTGRQPAVRVSRSRSHPPRQSPFVTLGNAYQLAGGSVAPISVAHNYKDAYVSEWNFGIEQQVGNDFKVAARYVGSKGTDLNIERNYNQFVNGARPYPALSASSPIDPGLPLSQYHGLRERRKLLLQRALAHGRQALRQGTAVQRFRELVEID